MSEDIEETMDWVARLSYEMKNNQNQLGSRSSQENKTNVTTAVLDFFAMFIDISCSG
jgi:hypothetical protein